MHETPFETAFHMHILWPNEETATYHDKLTGERGHAAVDVVIAKGQVACDAGRMVEGSTELVSQLHRPNNVRD